jgi:hypothetical protein
VVVKRWHLSCFGLGWGFKKNGFVLMQIEHGLGVFDKSMGT